MTNLTKSQIEKISFLNECLKSSKSEKITIGVIGGIKSYDEWFSIIHYLGISDKVKVVYLDDTRLENGCEFNIVSIDEIEKIPKIIISHNPKMAFSWEYLFENSKLKNPLE
jgi:hypothetical protein